MCVTLHGTAQEPKDEEAKNKEIVKAEDVSDLIEILIEVLIIPMKLKPYMKHVFLHAKKTSEGLYRAMLQNLIPICPTTHKR